MPDELKTTPSIVAFIDVLGSKELIKSDVDGSLNLVHRVYEKSIEIYHNVFEKIAPFDISIFSDNIVIAGKVSTEKMLVPCFRVIHIMAAIIQGNFLFSGKLVRGGIAYGSFFKDDIMVWGNALTKAYELESTVAIYPRIVIDRELVGKMELHHPKNKEMRSKLWLKTDIDGVLYVDYLQEKVIKDYEFVLLGELDEFDRRTIECHNDTKVMQKNIWQLNYVKSKLLGGISDASNEEE